MTIMEMARTKFDARRRQNDGELVVPYDVALSRAVTLAPLFRADREAFEAIPPCAARPYLPPRLRRAAAAAIVAACAASPLLTAWAAPASMLLGTLFGLAVAFTGDRIGAGLRTTPSMIGSDPSVLFGPCIAVAELAAVVCAAALAGGSTWPSLGLVALGGVAAAFGYLTRIGDIQAEQRENARLAARRRLDQSERALRRAVEALRAAHAADLARIAAEMGRPALAREVEPIAPG